jgi:probable rRNA maturation factor
VTEARAFQADVFADAGVHAVELDLLSELLASAARWEPSAPRGAWTMSLRLTSDTEIAELHARFFADPTPTDVISFPSGDDLAHPMGYLGDVVVSLDTAAENAALEGHSLARETAFLALHGLLHLCGHDDATAADRAAMLARQTELLERFERERGSRL